MCTGYLELMLSDIDIQVNGFVIIVDLANLSVLHKARLITPTLAWHLTMILQVTFIKSEFTINSQYSRLKEKPRYADCLNRSWYPLYEWFSDVKLRHNRGSTWLDRGGGRPAQRLSQAHLNLLNFDWWPWITNYSRSLEVLLQILQFFIWHVNKCSHVRVYLHLSNGIN